MPRRERGAECVRPSGVRVYSTRGGFSSKGGAGHQAVALFGAGGRTGRAVTAEARARGYRVTAVVRDPARHPYLEAEGVTVVWGDVIDSGAVNRTASGHVGACMPSHRSASRSRASTHWTLGSS
ncbi:NAD(P)H-binding protein [Streptomyces sp. NPDC018347]|uniref:NAD(P)H-binding protein n=1 Tax=Streptomyces sp. NPDC018347 TaxID=3157193 RepID=UPI003406F138